jgi:hypothetical protein
LTDAISAAGNDGTVQFTADCSITLSNAISLVQSGTIDGAGLAVTMALLQRHEGRKNDLIAVSKHRCFKTCPRRGTRAAPAGGPRCAATTGTV